MTFALGLRRLSVPCHIYEAASQFGEIGAGVGIGINAQRAMSLIDPRILAGYLKVSCENLDPSKRDIYFQFRMGMDGRGKAAGWKAGSLVTEINGRSEAEWVAGFDDERAVLGGFAKLEGEGHTKGGFGMSVAHRAHLLDELVELYPREGVSFGKRVKRIEQDGLGVVLYFADGSESARHSVAVGCDGIKSDVRRHLWGKEYDAVFSGKYAYRGLLPMAKALELLGDKALVMTAQNYVGHGGHFITMPIENGKLMNVVAFRRAKDGQWRDEKWVLPMQREHLMKDFEEWGEKSKKLLSLMERPDVWALFEDPPLPQYWKGRVAVIGDAAHASTPHQGAGAGMAIEDAYVLSSLLGLVKRPEQAEAAFRAYDEVRRERSQKLVTTSHNAGELYELHATGVDDDLDKLSDKLSHQFKWIWDEDVTQEFERAKKMFEDLTK